MSTYPIFLQVNSFQCLIVGGGKVATRKAQALIAAGALPVVLSPSITDELSVLVSHHGLRWMPRVFQQGDTSGFTIIIAATNDREVNRLIGNEAMAAGLLVNNTSDTQGSNFHVAATVRRLPLEIAIGTSGEVPYVSHKIKEYLDQKLEPGMGRELDEIHQRRAFVIERAGGNELLKKELMDSEIAPLVEQFLKHFI